LREIRPRAHRMDSDRLAEKLINGRRLGARHHGAMHAARRCVKHIEFLRIELWRWRAAKSHEIANKKPRRSLRNGVIKLSKRGDVR
jgi:hypothetical protein